MSSLITSPLDLLLPYQREWVDDESRFKMGIWSRQTGKDFSTAAEAVRDAMRRPKTEWMIAAPSERQAMESLNKCKEWSEAFALAIEDEQIERPDGPGTLMKSGSIQFGNGSRILAVPGKPDTVRGFSANLVLTEFAFFDDPDATWKAVIPSITNPLRGGQKRVRLITTPNGKSGRGARTYKIYKDNCLEPRAGRKQHWHCYKIDIETAVRMGLPVDIEELKEAFDDVDGWAQEFMCEFLDSSNVLLPYDIIALAESPYASLTIDSSYYRSGADIYLGIDFGRTNDPTVCWTLEKMENGVCQTREVCVLRNMSTPDQEEALRHRIRGARKVCFDYTGPGIGLGDYLVKEFGKWNPAGHEFGKIELCTFTQNFKRELFPKMRRWFEAPVNLRIPIDVGVREDLHAMQQIINNGQYSYEAPHTRAGHSDRCTALALCVRAADGITPPPLPRSWGSNGQSGNRRSSHWGQQRHTWRGIRSL